MPRHARLKLAGHPLHVIQRGVNRAACFTADSDYLLYLSLLEEIAPRYECLIHAFVLMTNHAHLLLTGGRADGASLLMKHLGQRYVQRFNRAHRRTGTLWEGRFRSCLVDSEQYLMRCQRYIELNPVRAGMTQHPAEYRWSSYLINAEGMRSGIVTPHQIYSGLGPTHDERLAAYRALFRGALADDEVRQIREAVNAGRVLGGRAYVADVEELLKRRVGHGFPGRPRKDKARGAVPPRGKSGSVPGFI